MVLSRPDGPAACLFPRWRPTPPAFGYAGYGGRARHGGKPSIDNLSRTFRALASKPGLLSGMNAALLS